ncbi:MAG: hypothetical protein B7Z38_01395 [Rhodobacterales bacterium 12-64-8]|nr:MAG: hypothetical protein B7Z38_01395 [Rhodobacterales bacterium 12-64-8]OYX46093.1 MAG: hypothetical protein B7Y90_16920 [Alphaproteobacteria bacterium 32-64-14]
MRGRSAGLAVLILSIGALVARGPAPASAEDVVACFGKDAARSHDGGQGVRLDISNQTKSAVQVVWLDPAGKPAPFDPVASGATSSISSFAGHAWRVMRDGDCLCQFALEPGGTRVEITADGQCRSDRALGVGFEPTSSYAPTPIEGWSVLVSSRIDSATRTTMLRSLGELLRDAGERLPPGAVAALRPVRFWAEADDLTYPGAVYHGDADWLMAHGINPEKAGEIQFTPNITPWRAEQPAMILHELAHAFEARVIGRGDARLAAAFEAAVTSGAYDHVKHITGDYRRAYALTDPSEYFAELSEAYFSTNDFYPFNRAQLKAFDPQGFAVVDAFWKQAE